MISLSLSAPSLHCVGPLCVETPEGRRAYALEQESLAALAVPVRERLLEAYDAALLQLSTL
jgi:hypothetical protein